jgi:hypothetical protein
VDPFERLGPDRSGQDVGGVREAGPSDIGFSHAAKSKSDGGLSRGTLRNNPEFVSDD